MLSCYPVSIPLQSCSAISVRQYRVVADWQAGYIAKAGVFRGIKSTFHHGSLSWRVVIQFWLHCISAQPLVPGSVVRLLIGEWVGYESTDCSWREQIDLPSPALHSGMQRQLSGDFDATFIMRIPRSRTGQHSEYRRQGVAGWTRMRSGRLHPTCLLLPSTSTSRQRRSGLCRSCS
jgi:hypothetical protein